MDKKYITKSGNYTARLLGTFNAYDNQTVIAVLKDIETGIEEVATYNANLRYRTDNGECNLDLVEVIK